jgi:flavorubredoxin
METRINEIADGIYRLSTYVAEVAPPAGFTFNQFLVKGEEPLLFHCGMRGIFPLVSGAVAKIVPVESLRWIGFGHVEADECGAMNQWLAAASH